MVIIPYEGRAKIYAQAAETFGRDNQITVAIEELSELTKELCKLKRLKGRLSDLAEEVADVTIMLEQLRILFDIGELADAIVDAKLRRLVINIEKAKEGMT